MNFSVSNMYTRMPKLLLVYPTEKLLICLLNLDMLPIIYTGNDKGCFREQVVAVGIL